MSEDIRFGQFRFTDSLIQLPKERIEELTVMYLTAKHTDTVEHLHFYEKIPELNY